MFDRFVCCGETPGELFEATCVASSAGKNRTLTWDNALWGSSNGNIGRGILQFQNSLGHSFYKDIIGRWDTDGHKQPWAQSALTINGNMMAGGWKASESRGHQRLAKIRIFPKQLVIILSVCFGLVSGHYSQAWHLGSQLSAGWDQDRKFFVKVKVILCTLVIRYLAYTTWKLRRNS